MMAAGFFVPLVAALGALVMPVLLPLGAIGATASPVALFGIGFVGFIL
jgi:hypothetical protein